MENLHVGRRPDVITDANFGDDPLRGLVVAGVKFFYCAVLRRHPYKHLTTTVVNVDRT